MPLTAKQSAFVSAYLGVPVPKPGQERVAPARPEGAGRVSFVELQKLRLSWDKCRKDVIRQVDSLEAKIVAHFKDAEDAREVAETATKLQSVLENIDESLLDTLDAALNADDPKERADLQREAGAITRDYIALLDSDPILLMIDDNPFQTTTVRAALRVALNDLRGVLG
ncbi:hypothetical protein OEW28_16495 [Defluviimonas sp. WL0002]|uniref:Uncharacterized protein n=1 Tax=Albidovulum marisflavi TaxID=2984159 RepID=A0ABT2ZGF9_9RHOB|nr:hypothetical protein [Defluviimonas sp. WL0002]MCV2870227.1 hypothetical protein [Defluviimonas sp. WL0002]